MLKKVFFAVAILSQLALAETTVVTIGTGSPLPNPEKMGPATLVIVDETPYLFDAGTGVQRRIQEAINKNPEKLKGVEISNIENIFLTHVHSDHILGLDEMIFGAWVGGRKESINVYGPEETPEVVNNLEKAYRSDRDIRLYGLEPATPHGYKANPIVTERDGLIYSDDKVKVTAFPVHHGTWTDSRGYMVETKDKKKILIGGDNSDPNAFVKYGKNADMILSEIYTVTNFTKGTEFMEENKPFWETYFNEFHTSTKSLAKAMNKLHPKLIVTTHEITFDQDSSLILKEMKDFGYNGKVISAVDMQVFEL